MCHRCDAHVVLIPCRCMQSLWRASQDELGGIRLHPYRGSRGSLKQCARIEILPFACQHSQWQSRTGLVRDGCLCCSRRRVFPRMGCTRHRYSLNLVASHSPTLNGANLICYKSAFPLTCLRLYDGTDDDGGADDLRRYSIYEQDSEVLK